MTHPAFRPASAFFVAIAFPFAPLAADEPYTQRPEVAESVVRGETAEPKTKPQNDRDALADGPQAKWIWATKPAGENDSVVLSTTFEGGEFDSARLIATCDNRMTVTLNGEKVVSGGSWQNPERADVAKHVKPGENTLEVRASNQGGPGGFALKLALVPQDGQPRYVVSDDSWQAKADPQANEAKPAVVVGAMGDAPWGDVFDKPAEVELAGGVPRDVFQTLPGYRVEKLFDVPKEELGSWVCLTTDDRGRLIASDQGDQGLCRITPAAGDQPTKVERIDVPMTACQGMLYAFGKLYCSVNGGPGSGFYVVEDTDGDDQFDEVTKLKDFQGGGEHGPHAIRLAPDGKSLYVIAGNHTDPPQDFDASRLPSNWDEDLLLPRQWDARGHARGKLAPGGWIAKTDPEGKTWEIVSSGYRNPYDMDFNADGELFAYDADMEWDMGSPWYRPTRVVHATSGSEFGWRSGTGKWPTYFEDSLPPVVDVGPGSPVGVTFGYGARFPARYEQALFILDWTFGTIYAIHLTPDGASYAGEKEEFLSRTPLPLTDAVVGADGALYFAIGGRGAESALFRVTYVGDAVESTEPVNARNQQQADLRALRHRLESLHRSGEAQPEDLALIRENLGHEDRFVRYAARVALEHRPVETWREWPSEAKQPWPVIQLAIALARQGEASDQPRLLESLDRLEFAELRKPRQLGLLRAYALTFIRLGEPDQETASALAQKFDAFYPADDADLNRELSRMLVYLESPTVITKTLELMEQPYKRSPAEMSELIARNPRYGGTIAQMLANQPELQNVHYAFVLRNVKYGWTLEQRKQYVQWLEKAKGWSGGASYTGFLDNIKEEALANASEAERKAIESAVVEYRPPSLDELPKPEGPGRDWTVEELVELAAGGLTGRDYEQGRKMYAAAQCIRCHRYLGEGGATGPDLTNVAGRFGVKEMAEALIEPSKVVSDQYRASTILTTKGKVVNGRILGESDGKLTVLTDPVDATQTVEIDEDDVEMITPSKTSLMPKDLLDTLSAEEVLDLLAYLYSRGNPNDRMFSAE